MKYRMRPVVVEAEQFWPNKKPWPEGLKRDHDRCSGYSVEGKLGVYTVFPGEFVAHDSDGNCYVYSAQAFREEFEPISDENCNSAAPLSYHIKGSETVSACRADGPIDGGYWTDDAWIE